MNHAKNCTQLTIGIPTYNGELTIADCIESCLASIRFADITNVEVLVVDNCSTDDTVQRVKEFAIQHPGVVRVIANASNIGLDKNVDRVFYEARGTYVKLLGDDDVIDIYFVKTFHETISRYPCDVLLSAYLDYEQYRSHDSFGLTALHKHERDFSILVNSRGIAGQIASITCKRTSYLDVDSSHADDTNNKFLYIVTSLVSKGVSVFDSVPKVYVRAGSPRFTTAPMSSFTSQMKTIRMYQALLIHGGPWTPIERKFIGNLIISQRRYSLTFIDFIHRYTDLNSLQVIKLFYPLGKSLPSFYLRYLPMALVPKRIGNYIARAIKG